MIEFLLSLPTWIGCALAMVSTTLLGLVVYVISYKFNEKYKIIELKPANSIQKDMKSGLLADIDTMSDHRFIRLNHSMAEPPVYTLVIIFGFIVSMARFGAYQPHISLITLASLYTFFIGMVFYLILAMSDPFQGGTILDPTSFEYVIEAVDSGLR